MSRKLGIEYPEAAYYVVRRGNHMEAIYRADADRELFLKCLGEACAKTDWRLGGCVPGAVDSEPVTLFVNTVPRITTETAKLDALHAAAEHTMALLKERRAALIAAAVTGKLPIPA